MAHQHVDRNRDPDLGLQSVLAGAVESLNAQVLLDPLEQVNDILPINSALLKLRSNATTVQNGHKDCGPYCKRGL